MKFKFKFIVKYLRPIWSNIIKFIYYLYYLFIYFTDIKAKMRYDFNKLKYYNISDLIELTDYFVNIYKYKYDGPKGIFDHNNSKLEFFISFGDCDDVMNFVEEKLKLLKYRTGKVFIYTNKLGNYHFDCCYEYGDSVVLFNYGKLIQADGLKECVEKLGDQWPNFKDAKYFLI